MCSNEIDLICGWQVAPMRFTSLRTDQFLVLGKEFSYEIFQLIAGAPKSGGCRNLQDIVRMNAAA
jgi:hypothetical protein